MIAHDGPTDRGLLGRLLGTSGEDEILLVGPDPRVLADLPADHLRQYAEAMGVPIEPWMAREHLVQELLWQATPLPTDLTA